MISCNYLQSIIQDNSGLSLYDDTYKSLSVECVECTMNLLSCGISSERIGTLMKTVYRLCGRVANRVPSRQAVERINTKRLALAHTQVEDIVQSSSKITLCTDEQSIKGRKYTVYATTAKSDTQVLGVDLPSKSARDTFSGLGGAFQNHLWALKSKSS